MDTERELGPTAPNCNCLILCDDVIESKIRGKHTLSGVITAILVPEMPYVLGPYMCYLRLTNVRPEIRLQIVLDHADEEKSDGPLFEGHLTMPSETDPIGLYTIPIPTPRFVVKEPGLYILSVRDGGGIPIVQMPLSILRLPRE